MKRHFKYGFLAGSILLILQFIIIWVINKMGINIPFFYQIIIYVLILLAINCVIFYLLRDKGAATTESRSSGGITCEMIGTDENTKLVIKSIGTTKHGFKNFSDIVNETNLPLKTINYALDWLVMNKLATEIDGRKGKVYELSQMG